LFVIWSQILTHESGEAGFGAVNGEKMRFGPLQDFDAINAETVGSEREWRGIEMRALKSSPWPP